MFQWADLLRHPGIRQLVAQLAENGPGAINMYGLWGSFGSVLIGLISQQLGRPILYVKPYIDDTFKAFDDLQTVGIAPVEMLAAWEGPEDLPDAADPVRAQRVKVVMGLCNGSIPAVTCASIQALCQPVPTAQSIQQGSIHLVPGCQLCPDELARWLVQAGFESVDRLEMPGQFARRGGIMDIFAPIASMEGAHGSGQDGLAIRMEFFGETIDTIRKVDLDTHRSTDLVQQVRLVSPIIGQDMARCALFLDLLPDQTLVAIEEPSDCQQVTGVLVSRSAGKLFGWPELYRALGRFTQLHMARFGAPDGQAIGIDVHSVQQYQIRPSEIDQTRSGVFGNIYSCLDQLIAQARCGKKVYLFCEGPAELERMGQIASGPKGQLPANLHLVQGYLAGGFAIESLGMIVVTHHELFGQHPLRRITRSEYQTVRVDSVTDLEPGDYVVHAVYGIGRFLGIQTMEGKTGQAEYLAIEYADKAKIHVAASNIHLVQKYIGTGLARPKLSKISSKAWQRQKEKVFAAVTDLAAEMLATQAKRQAIGGYAFGTDSQWQRQFEASFPYVETPDQTTAMDQIKADMARPVAMDRLLCGDVGYGKTELAMRAAFKAVECGKQVAVLVPTTVLSVQHCRTFRQRFADFPVCIEVLNRFKSPAEVADILERLSKGAVDILIGTHRLLTADVQFKDLGLLIIDEEQRFGVEHKERLKRLRVNVDILTMTATPIPRTLHMSLIGLRDISCLASPPLDRRSVATIVARYDPQLIRKAVIAELDRGGQVFYLHNRVRTIDRCTWQVRRLLADTSARIGVAHGQMGKLELERTMVDFVEGRIDVLICTTIIESGLDIPNANTIIIEDADRFGLSDLHQLRGRVGRFWRRAYAYMLLPTSRPISPMAVKRLKAIEEYSQLGAGFRIALRDLEIRGAGNILGPEQSGHIQAVGYHMYCQLLAQAVRRLRNEQVEPVYKAAVDLGFAVSIPKAYIASDRLRMEMYRRIAQADTTAQLDQIASELKDVYGPVPQEVELYLQLARLRLDAGAYGLDSIRLTDGRLVFSFRQPHPDRAARLFSRVRAVVRIPDPKTVIMEVPERYCEPQTILAVLRKILRPAGAAASAG